MYKVVHARVHKTLFTSLKTTTITDYIYRVFYRYAYSSSVIM